MISKTDYIVNLNDTIMIFYINKNNKYFNSETDFCNLKRQYYISY